MPTALTILFPSGYATREGASEGMIDEIELVDDRTGEVMPLEEPISSGTTLVVRGWAVDTRRGLPAAGVIVTLGDAVVEASYGGERGDIADFFGSDAVRRVGFRVSIAPPPGAHGTLDLRAYAVSSDALEIAILPGGRSVDVVRGDAITHIKGHLTDGFGEVHLDAVCPAGADRAPTTATRPVVVERGNDIIVRGWGIERERKIPLHGVMLIVDDCDIVRARIGLPRNDVVDMFGARALLSSGFEVRFNTSGLTPGTHRLKLGIIGQDEAYDIVPIDATLEILSPLRVH